MAENPEARGTDIKTHWRHFTGALRSKSFVVGADYAPRSYSYCHLLFEQEAQWGRSR